MCVCVQRRSQLEMKLAKKKHTARLALNLIINTRQVGMKTLKLKEKEQLQLTEKKSEVDFEGWSSSKW